MIAESTPPAVVVGVDGSPGALWAVRWAAVEAVGRGMPLRLVFAVDPECEAGVDRTDLRDRRVAETVLAEAIHQARIAHASVDVAAEVVHESPRAALARGAGCAAMICLGSNGMGPAHPGHRTSTATELVLTADCPVAVVRGPVPRHGWAVAWIDADPSLFDVFHLAVTEALLRNLPLRLLTAWTVRSAAPVDVGAEVDRRLRRELDRWRQRYPHLDAVVVAAPNLDDFLSRNAHRIALFVAPQRQTHDVGTVVHPSVETAIRLLECPVLIDAGATGLSAPNAAPVIGASTQLFP
jgi:nucleotide-binding universal stress UspA family protein